MLQCNRKGSVNDMIKINEKAFTLMELLAVIAILAVIALITYPAVTKIINQKKEDIYEQQVFEIERATEGYVAENISEVLPVDTTSAQFSLDYLKENGVIQSDEIINPKTGKEMNGCVLISLDSNNQYHAKYSDTPCNER